MRLPREAEIKIEMRKASFGGDRSEAGRYAANVRWQNREGEQLKESGENTTTPNLTAQSGKVIDIEKIAPDKRNEIQDIKDVSTSEEDFARRLDLLIDRYAKRGQNITTKRSKNESSNGTKINPAKLHSDDRGVLAEKTDPEERMKYIDELLAEPMYGDRIVARPSRKKQAPYLEQIGFISRA